MRFDASKRLLVIALDECLNPVDSSTSKATGSPAVTFRQALLARERRLVFSIEARHQVKRLFEYCKFCFDCRMLQEQLATNDKKIL